MRADAALVLMAMGYSSLHDFSASTTEAGDVRIIWLAGTPMPSEAEIEAFVNPAAALVTRTAQAVKAAASASIDRGAMIDADLRERIEFAIVDAIRVEFNRHRDFEVAFKAAVANATGATPAAVWADFQARVAAISVVPQRSLADLAGVIKNAISGTPE